MKVMIGCPVQNRDWILPYYLERLNKMLMVKEDIHLAFLVNNSQDKSICILKDFKEENEWFYDRITVAEKTNFDYVDLREGTRNYNCIAEVKNDWMSLRRKSDDYAFMIDSDVLVPEMALLDLLYYDKEIISGLVTNGTYGKATFYNIMKRNRDGSYHHIRKFDKGLVEVDATGACCLYSKKVLNSGIVFEYHKQGEDIGFCSQAKAKGFRIFCNTNLETEHVMIPEMLKNLDKQEDLIPYIQ